MDDTLLTVTQVANKLGVARQTVHVYLKSGKLDSIKFGHNRRIPASALQRFLDAGFQPATTPPTRRSEHAA